MNVSGSFKKKKETERKALAQYKSILFSSFATPCTYNILVPQPGIELEAPAVDA